jgi:hypothetical protein
MSEVRKSYLWSSPQSILAEFNGLRDKMLLPVPARYLLKREPERIAKEVLQALKCLLIAVLCPHQRTRLRI